MTRMRYLAIALGVAAASCKPSPATTSPVTRGTSSVPVPWFAIADLVAFRDGDITAYSIADTLVEVGHLHIAYPGDLPPGGLDGHWAGHDHLFVKTADRAISHITAAGAVARAVTGNARASRDGAPGHLPQMLESSCHNS